MKREMVSLTWQIMAINLPNKINKSKQRMNTTQQNDGKDEEDEGKNRMNEEKCESYQMMELARCWLIHQGSLYNFFFNNKRN